MTRLLAGDIGGTKTILRLESVDAEGRKVLSEQTYPSQDWVHLVPMVQDFLPSSASERPAVACFAIAGPVQNQTSRLSNLAWILSEPDLSRDLHIPQVKLLNDFVAVGYGILILEDSDVEILQYSPITPQAPIAVLGAGTGLGEALLIWQGDDYDVIALEGGHADFAPRTDLEIGLLQYLRDRHGRVSVERVVSGLGIPTIYEYLRDTGRIAEADEVRSRLGTELPAAIIAEYGLSKKDELCAKTLDLFVAAYGAEAGNLALKSLPFGGLYIAGGVGPKLKSKMKDGSFVKNFCDKGRMRSLLERIRINLILNPKVGLLGAVSYAQRMAKRL